jgi:hypothetical protein
MQGWIWAVVIKTSGAVSGSRILVSECWMFLNLTGGALMNIQHRPIKSGRLPFSIFAAGLPTCSISACL